MLQKLKILSLAGLLMFCFEAHAKTELVENVECTFNSDKGSEYCLDERGMPFSGKRAQYYNNDTRQSIESYRNGYRDGRVSFFDNDGKISERLYYKSGIKNGMDKVYYSNRTIKYLKNYKDGLLDGRMDIYSEDGTLRGRVTYHHGMLTEGYCVDEEGRKTIIGGKEKSAYKDNNFYDCGV